MIPYYLSSICKDRQQELFKACRQQIGRTISMAGAKDCPLPADKYANYGIIWYHEHLTRTTQLEDVKKDIAQNAKRILIVAADVIRRTFPLQT
jgi:hypothetical protein